MSRVRGLGDHPSDRQEGHSTPTSSSRSSSANLPGRPPSQHQQQAQTHPLGSREDVEQEDYQSPLTLMYGRAWERYRTAETNRQMAQQMTQQQMAQLQMAQQQVAQQQMIAQSRSHTIADPHHYGIAAMHRQVPSPYSMQAQLHTAGPPGLAAMARGVNENIEPANAPIPPIRQRANFHTQFYGTSTDRGMSLLSGELRAPNYYTPPIRPIPPARPDFPPTIVSSSSITQNPIDRQTERPEPLSKEDMTVNIACKMCLEQKIDTLIEPCMHLAMCRWCSDVWQQNARQLRQADPGVQNAWKCPICRRPIAQIRRVYF